MKACYYGKFTACSLIKVVVWLGTNASVPATVITAYEINTVKESKYPHLKRLA